jgi:nicotinic acid mononucleotide adenylyltransferase
MNPYNENNFTNEIEKMAQELSMPLDNNIIQLLLTTFTRTTNKLTKQNNKRLGFFSVIGDPIHWGHLLSAYEILVEYELDKIIFLVGVEDKRKPNLTNFSIRKPMIIEALKIFGDLFEFSDITTIENNYKNDGETNMFLDIIRRNDQRIQAYYIAGSDHFNWQSTKGDDTIKKLYDNIEYYQIPISGSIFIARNPEEITPIKIKEMENKLNSRYKINIMIPSLSFSSTQIRKELNNNDVLIMIPYVVYQHIKTNNLYQLS